MDTIGQLKQLLYKQFDIDPGTIDPDAPFAEYNLDSLTVAELMFAIEDHFHVDVPDSAATSISTLRGLAQMLDSLLSEARQ
ncbi:MAG TPA: acyl carrier protein [Burkholderiaceae bacterium]|nr:acyl carrier protein [Burkholderiaceae bacterium]